MAFTMKVADEAANDERAQEPFTMEVPDEAAIKKEVLDQVRPAPEEVGQLQSMAEDNVEQILALDIGEFGRKKYILASIDSFGVDSMKGSAAKNSLLQVTVGHLSRDGDEGGVVAKGLTDLNRELKELDPGLIDFTRTGILGKIFDPVRAYFSRYQKADSAIAEIILSLERGKAILKNDNTTLEIEQEALRGLTKKLMKEIELGILMDRSIEMEIEAARAGNEDPEKVRFVAEEVLFPLRQRVMDMQQMVIVNQQGVMAMEVVLRNNKELIRGVDRAQTVTISALRTAVTVAGALYNQRIVLKKIEMLNDTTNDIIRGTSQMLKYQGAEIQRRSMETNISVEGMKAAFADVMEALDSISTYKQEALPRMRDTVHQFKELAAIGEEQIKQIEEGRRLTD
ncbi:toxic anion resistance protein [Candidatus Methanocrinis natronophilus]|uniref:Toxic anion resistance protein n=1 Tax=Candidatus Methanocrinis natronophilus TaxID=3033396 RepID=A0ABT5X920_9EURY|nr:toxic anion resistance protein [Candidatus Methanocrinis natronophilus]MDF0591158.1 toxic anion resistance protein [Candidatus Methanocrinis natronophilus]